MDKHDKPDTPLFEDKEIELGPVLKGFLALLIIGGLVHVIIWAEFFVMDEQRKKADPAVSPLIPKQSVPSGPHLEALKPAASGSENEPFVGKSLKELRSQEANMLDSYAWVDERSGMVRIPIHVAMKKIVEKESQKQTESSQTQTAPNP